MRAGELRNLIGFLQRQTTTDSFGNTTGGYAADPDFEAAANVVPKLGGETILAARLSGTNYVNITVRQSSQTRAVTVDWLAKDMRSGETFNIRSIIDPNEGEVERGVWLEMLCEKGVAT